MIEPACPLTEVLEPGRASWADEAIAAVEVVEALPAGLGSVSSGDAMADVSQGEGR